MKSFAVFSFAFAGLFAFSTPALAIEINDIAESITTSSTDLSGLVAALAYLLGIVFLIGGIFKLKDHVENPAQNPLRNALIRFIVGGALFALPIVYEAMLTTLNGGTITLFDISSGVMGTFFNLLGGAAGLPGLDIVMMDFNSVMASMIESISDVPGFISALAYLLGLVLGVSGLLKLKDHVENPEQNPLREGVIRLLIGGALFGLTTVYQAMAETMPDGFDISSIFAVLNFLSSGYASGFLLCNPLGGFMSGGSIGDSLCSILTHTGAFPAFLTAISYLLGLVFGFWGIFKIKAHVINPSQTSISEGISRLLAGGAFFTLPILIEVARNTVVNPVSGIFGWAVGPVTGYNEPTAGACAGGAEGLDCAMISMMNDLLGPMHVVLNFFALCAGMVFIMIGISRLIKSAQDGARGPGGLGTIGTFLAGGALISYNELVRAASRSLSMSDALGKTHTYVEMAMADTPELAQAHTVISAILKFMIIVGLISFVRGVFIIRGVAEGNNQSSLMAGATHVVGGALAVNLGPLIMAVQNTLGVSSGITFS
ncbi:MAG: hypothetical protein ACT4OY_03840 [Alphaproteobacteria bacterium]